MDRKTFVLLALLLACIVGIVRLSQPATASVTEAWPAEDARIRDLGTTTAINLATATDHTVVAATSGKQLLIVGLFIQSEGAQDVTIKSGATSLTSKTGAIEFADGDYLYLDLSSAPIMLASGEELVLTLSQAVQINGWVTTVLR